MYLMHIQVAEGVSKIPGIRKVLVADNEAFKGFLPGTVELLCYISLFVILSISYIDLICNNSH